MKLKNEETCSSDVSKILKTGVQLSPCPECK